MENTIKEILETNYKTFRAGKRSIQEFEFMRGWKKMDETLEFIRKMETQP